MKKLIVMTAAALCGLVVSASTVNWTAVADTCVATPGSEAGEYDGFLVYIINDHTTAASGIGSLIQANANDLGTYLDGVKLGSGAVDYDYFDLGGTGLVSYDKTIPGKEEPQNTASIYAVILNANDAGTADKYYVTAVSDMEITTSVEKGGAGYNLGNIVIGANDWQSITAAPEPTSGLLLLLGVAGLALKRRRA